MAEPSTFIKLDRNITRWRWYKNANTFRVFVHLLIEANISDHDFEMAKIHRGEVATSYGRIAEDLGLSYKAVRTALERLKETGEAAIKRYPKFLVISIVNYDLYQAVPAIKRQSKTGVLYEQTINKEKNTQKRAIKTAGSNATAPKLNNDSGAIKTAVNGQSVGNQRAIEGQQLKKVKNLKKERIEGDASNSDEWTPPEKGTPEYDAWRNQ